MENKFFDKVKIDNILRGDNKILNEYANFLAKEFAPQNQKEKEEKLSTSQIRNILDDVQRMKREDIENGKYELLRYKIAYVAGKNQKSMALRELKKILDYAIQNINNDNNRFENFKNFFEAIVGYHRFYSKVKD